MRPLRCVLSVFLALPAACGGGSGPVLTLDARGGYAAVEVQGGEAGAEYALGLFSAPTPNASGSGSFTLSIEPSVSTRSVARSVHPAPAGVSRLSRRVYGESLRRAEIVRLAHAAKAAFRNDARLAGNWQNRLRSSYGTRSALSETIPLLSPFEGEKGQAITGILRAQGGGAAVYVDSRSNHAVSAQLANAVINAFASVSLPRLRTLFGEPSDVDGNGAIIIFMADSELIGSDYLGFFRPADLLPAGLVPGVVSNEGEYLYIRVPTAADVVELIHATAAHETVHLIEFAAKTLDFATMPGGSFLFSEETFLSEGLAHLAEDLVGFGVDTPLLTWIYLNCLPHTSLAGPGATFVPEAPYCAVAASGYDSLPRRGGMMLMLLYAFKQAGGAVYSTLDPADISGGGVRFLRALIEGSKRGIPNIEAASGRNFFSLYADFSAALILDATIGAEARHSFEAQAMDSFTGLIRNVRMRSQREDIDGTIIRLDGPASRDTLRATNSIESSASMFSSGAVFHTLFVPPRASAILTVRGDSSLALGLTLAPIQHSTE